MLPILFMTPSASRTRLSFWAVPRKVAIVATLPIFPVVFVAIGNGDITVMQQKVHEYIQQKDTAGEFEFHA